MSPSLRSLRDSFSFGSRRSSFGCFSVSAPHMPLAREMVLEVRLQSRRKNLAVPGVLMTCGVCGCSVPLSVLMGGLRMLDDVVGDEMGCVSMCSCFSLGSYFVLMLSDGCSVILAVVFSEWLIGLCVLLTIPA